MPIFQTALPRNPFLSVWVFTSDVDGHFYGCHVAEPVPGYRVGQKVEVSQEDLFLIERAELDHLGCSNFREDQPWQTHYQDGLRQYTQTAAVGYED